MTYDKPSHAALRNKWLVENPLTRFDGYRWLRYVDNYWQPIHTGFIEQEIDRLVCDSEGEGIKPTDSLINSVLGMARKRSFINPALLDAQPEYLPCQNGVLHLPTRILYPHSPDYYITSLLPYPYDPVATAPRWQHAIHTTHTEAVISLFQEFSGYCTTTDTKQETALWLHGPRGSGKSTFIQGLQTMLGHRAGLLGLGEIRRSRFALCNIPGKTLLFATEQPTSADETMNVVNRIISGEHITVEEKYKNAFEIIPRAKICWAMNSLPTINDVNDGIFRRVRIIEFEKRTGEIIPEIKEEIGREGAGILNWSLLGLDRLTRRNAFELPESVLNATRDYEQNSDMVALFVGECCEVDPEYKEQSGALLAAYRNWCTDRRLDRSAIKSHVALAEDWKRLGFSKSVVGKVAFWHGLRLTYPPHL